MNIHDYLIDQAGLDWKSLLEEWHWVLPPKFHVWLLTRAGDLFITLPDASIQMLDVGAGTLSHIAANREEFYKKLDETGVADEWLMIPVVNQLVSIGVQLSPGECYSFRKLPIFGGAYDANNRMAFPIHEHFGGWGSIHRQIADLPDGSEVIIEPTEQP